MGSASFDFPNDLMDTNTRTNIRRLCTEGGTPLIRELASEEYSEK